MTQPTTYGGRPAMPGAAAPELRIARFRTHARRLFWPAIVLIALAGVVGYLAGNLPVPFEDWMLFSAVGLIALFAVILPFALWWSHTFTVTTRRVMERSGLFAQHRRELSHLRGYTIQVRRGILQRMWGAGTLVLSNGVDQPLRLANIPSAELVHEALVDQVEVAQILAHRDAQSLPGIPPVPPLPV